MCEAGGGQAQADAPRGKASCVSLPSQKTPQLMPVVPGYRWAMEVVPLRVYTALPAGNVLVASTGADSSPRHLEASWQDGMSEAQGLSDRVL